MDEVSLKEYFEARITALDKATSIASTNLEKRLDSMNEFRAALKDQTSTFVPRTEFDSIVDKMQLDIRLLRESKASNDGRVSQQALIIAYIVTGISVALSIASFLMKAI
jgi:hypothetical protein